MDLRGHETAATVQALGTLYTWNLLSPRVGVTARLTSDGRTMLRASYGRFIAGRLPNDRRHVIRTMSSVDIPHTGFVVAANFQ